MLAFERSFFGCQGLSGSWGSPGFLSPCVHLDSQLPSRRVKGRRGSYHNADFVRSLLAQSNPETPFSAWMLKLPGGPRPSMRLR